MSGDVALHEVAAVLGDGVVATRGDLSVVVQDVHHDSRAVTAGGLFVAVPGNTVDGHDYAAAAVAHGATALILQRDIGVDVPSLIVADARRSLGPAAAVVHGRPDLRLDLVGVTGTNGKTSITYLLEAIADAAHRPFGLAGTIGARIRGRSVPQARTTPEASDLIRLLANMTGEGVDTVALEVSSHAMVLGRVDGIEFKVAAFTNLSQDHLDFHGDMERYYLAKRSLFTPDRTGHAVIWIDDPAGVRLASETEVPVTTVGTSTTADVRITPLGADLDGVHFDLAGPDGSSEIRVPQPGSFMIANAALAAVCAMQIGVPLDAVAEGLGSAAAPPGRMERIPGPGFTVFVDYAHTPDAIESVIDVVRSAGAVRVIAVAGAGGDRDRGKRPFMGRALSRADVAVVTNDNPRSEDPDAIIAAVTAGMSGPAIVEPDRRRAITTAIEEAGAGDVVLVLGKGHEPGQELADGVVVPFDDRRVVADVLASATTVEAEA